MATKCPCGCGKKTRADASVVGAFEHLRRTRTDAADLQAQVGFDPALLDLTASLAECEEELKDLLHGKRGSRSPLSVVSDARAMTGQVTDRLVASRGNKRLGR